MIKNTLKKSLALGLLMTFLITGSVWAADPNQVISGNHISSTNQKPSSSDAATTQTSIVAMGNTINYKSDSSQLVLLGKTIYAEGERLVYIGSNINQELTEDEIKSYIKCYITDKITPSGGTNYNGDNSDKNLVAIGSLIDISGKNSVAIGTGVEVNANNSVAIGSGSKVTKDNTVSFGRDEEVVTIGSASVTIPEINRTLTHVAKGVNDTDAVNYGQIRILEERTQNMSATKGKTNFNGNIKLVEGTLNVNDKFAVDTDGDIKTYGSLNVNDKFAVGTDGDIKTYGTLNVNDKFAVDTDGDIKTYGTLNINDKFVVDTDGDIKTYGTLNVNDKFAVDTDGDIKTYGTLNINDKLKIDQSGNLNTDGTIKGSTITDGKAILEDGTLKVEDAYSINADGSASFANGKFNVAENGDVSVGGNNLTIEAATGNTNIDGTLNVAGNTVLDNNLNVKGNADFDKDVNINGTLNLTGKLTATGGAAITAENGGKLSVDSNGVGLASNTNSILAVTDNGIGLANNNSLVVIDSAGTTFANGSSQGLTNINGGNITTTGTASFANGNFTIDNVGNTKIDGTLDVTSTNGQLTVKDNYVVTRVTRGTSNNATTAGSINTGNFIGERVKNSNGSEFTATGKNTDGIINVAYKDGIYTDVLQTSSGIKVITKSANDNTFGSQTDIGTKITGTDVSIEDPKNTSNRIYLSDVGQVKNVDAELKANSNYVNSPTVVGAINAEADIRRAQFAKLGNKIEKVGAGAAALAAMHPLDFDPDDKLQFSAGVGNYGGETATALGAFYRPTEKVMFNIAGTMGNDENMMNAGVTFALDGRNNVSNSRVAMAREIQDLRAQVAQLTNNQAQMMALLNKVLDGQADELLANVMFPDVPENHWAYEYLDSLQKRGIIKGYPDGSFDGDRSLTRYEYATMLFRVLDQGISVDTRLLDEFEAELGRIRIDRIKGKDDSANKIERVRVNSSSDRDDYGSQIINTSAPTTN